MNSIYDQFLSPKVKSTILKNAKPVSGVGNLVEVGQSSGLENSASLKFLCELYQRVAPKLNEVLKQRIKDRKFIDERVASCQTFNTDLQRDFLDSDYKTVLGLQDDQGRIVFGPKSSEYYKANSQNVAPIPNSLQGDHVTLFGPPDSAKLSINAMNCYHRKLKDEPAIVGELLSQSTLIPKWGADDEDSKTPLRVDLVEAGVNLSKCFDKTLSFEDQKSYTLEKEKLALPIKRIPGLALPCLFLFYENEPLPLHLYDFSLHLFKNWKNSEALTFYIPKLETEEEAAYIKFMIETAENMIHELHPEYKTQTVKLMIVLENPRAIFRVNEIMDELYPYFAGASLGWHDYLAATARLFKEDKNYRIPVKADPNIVIKYIKASHELLANVVGNRGGIKIGGMYGVLPTNNNLFDDSFQVCLKGFIRDVVTQYKRNLNGFWVAHPDFVRLGLALVHAFKIHQSGDSSSLKKLITDLLIPVHQKEILDFIESPDIESLKPQDPLFDRTLIIAASPVSKYIANNHPDEVRYNIFQSLQYLTDWLAGNGCVALPAMISNMLVRVMDDLATAERSRWEVWAEIKHGRFDINEFLKIAHEELLFIRKDKSNDKKIVQVKWNERTEKWYPVAFKIMLKLMTDLEPVEFATELLLPFTHPPLREAKDPWLALQKIDADRYSLSEYVERFNYYFEMCGSLKFAKTMAPNLAIDFKQAQNLIMSFDLDDVLSAASFHGDIGESKKDLDSLAKAEQQKVDFDQELQTLARDYLKKFGMKFLVSAKDKTSSELLAVLKNRFNNSFQQELTNAKEQLWLITQKRMNAHPLNNLQNEIDDIFKKQGIDSAQVAILTKEGIQNLSLGNCNDQTCFEFASLSKSVASAFALEYFKNKNISLETSVNALLKKTQSKFQIPDGDAVLIKHLMNHTALNMHYVNGVPANQNMPKIAEFLNGNKEFEYAPIKVANPAGTKFQYSGGGFIVLEHLIEALENKNITELTKPFLEKLNMINFTFDQRDSAGHEYAKGYDDTNNMVVGGRKMFPAFAAGAMGDAKTMAKFLRHLENSFHHSDTTIALSHDTACLMLHGEDLGSQKFMGSNMGLGIFVAEAGPNKFALHQGANDGFRALFLHCFSGPDLGKGFVLLCNADFKGVLFNANLAQILLKHLNFQGIDFSKFKTNFDVKNIAKDEVVNIGYKSLIFDAFIPTRAEEIIDKGEVDPLAIYNLAVGATVIEVSNDKFARAENLISTNLPKFDPTLFGREGKIMDSWESVRHNLKPADTLILALKKPASISYILLSTKYHHGNHAPAVTIEGLVNNQWVTILEKTELEGHSEIRIKLAKSIADVSQVKITMLPDGGLSRLGLYHDLPKDVIKTFELSGVAKCISYDEKIPQTLKPLSIPYDVNTLEIDKNFSKLKAGEEFNNASSSYGAKIISASNEHYSPAKLVISPFAPINMFDGLESARSRTPGHFDEAVIALAKKSKIHRIEMNFSYFVNNNPMQVSIEGKVGNTWIPLVEKTFVKAFRGNTKVVEVNNPSLIEQVKVQTWPDGGMNRIKIFSKYEGP